MTDADKEIIGFIVFIGLILLGVGYKAGWSNGHDTAIRETLCREFMKETPDYINCNTKGLDEVIKLIKEQTDE